MTSFRDGNGKATGYDHDALDRLTKLTRPGAVETLFDYDARDNLERVTDANAKATVYGYDDRGDLKTLDSPDAGLEDFTYDAAGNVASRTDANNVTATFAHDALNRPTGVFFPDSSQNVAYGYDSGAYGKGRPTSASDSSGNTSYQYNALGQATRETRSMDGRTYATAYAYDPTTADLKTVTYPSGLAVTYSRDGNGRVTGIVAGGRTIAENVSYMPFGPAKGMTLGPVAVSRSFDQRYLTTGIAAGSLMNLTYAHDGAGNVKSVDGLPRPVLIPGTTDYAFAPGTNRLESSSGRGARSYAYDNAGNIVSDGIRDFVYDQRNRLARIEIGGATVAEYAYDAFHRRVKKVVDGETTYFHYDGDGLLICETDGNGNALRDYVYLNGEPVAMRVAGDWYWFLNDHLGTPRKMVDASGAVVWKAAYLPFGRAIVGLADVENNLRFPGQYFDAETGLHYNWHRYYDPGTGRYLRADPIGLAGGINLFAYAGNNPVNNFDKNGLFWDTFLDIGFMIWDVVDIATADNPCERRAAFTSLGMDALGAAIPFATGLGAGKRVAKRGPKLFGIGSHNKKIKEVADSVTDGVVVSGGQRHKERLIPTPGGKKSGRRPDILVERADGSQYGINVGKQSRKTGAPIKREAEAINDLEGAGVEMRFVPYK